MELLRIPLHPIILPRARNLFLECLQILDHIVQTHFSVVTVLIHLMKDWPPNRHFSGTMGEDLRFISDNDLVDTIQRKDTPVSLRHRGEVRHFGGECGSYRAVSCAVQSMAGSTMSAVDVLTLERVHRPGGSLLWSSLGLVVNRCSRCRCK